jgi:hypothetical protein
MSVSAEEFLRRFLQHVLPRGFQKVRHYGFASAVRRKEYDLIRWLVTLAMGLSYLLQAAAPVTTPRRTEFRCEQCGGPVIFFEFIRPLPAILDTS